jgi:trimethylamine--corrinoid protein Co-methyltransferase
MANYETAYYEAVLSDSNNVEQWQESGGKDAARRAYDRWNQILKDYQAPPLDQAKDEALQEFIAKRKAEIPDAWY